MAIPASLKVFTSPAQRADGSVEANNVRANDNALMTTVNALITELTAVEAGLAPAGLSPFLLMGA